jgi:hypothetical protein
MEINLNELRDVQELESNTDDVVETAVEYDRVLVHNNPLIIRELVENVFMPICKQETDPFYESNEDTIKWCTSAMEPIQIVLIEGLLSHRASIGLLKDCKGADGTNFRAFPQDAQFLNGTIFLGGIESEDKFAYTLQNVVRMAGIETDGDNIIKFVEPVSADMPQMLKYVMVLIGLDDTQISNLKKSFTVRKAGDKVKKMTNNFNTVTAGLLTTAVDDVAIPGMEMAGRTAGIVGGGVLNGVAKGSVTALNELTGSIVRADYANYKERKQLVANCKAIKASLGFKQQGSANLSW